MVNYANFYSVNTSTRDISTPPAVVCKMLGDFTVASCIPLRAHLSPKQGLLPWPCAGRVAGQASVAGTRWRETPGRGKPGLALLAIPLVSLADTLSAPRCPCPDALSLPFLPQGSLPLRKHFKDCFENNPETAFTGFFPSSREQDVRRPG